ncbi:NPCBM/NEW2 domain-containing protein [Thermogutta terrifontis]|uniref:NPCBM/NEW2 domain-containing protein n=1 Tax=Thermogutta terrifontis TaxID=1331910 RepID=UPI0012FDB156|nr:NPCBM/NEW2 domain-containing protein [Thermogutta terrifontis]
MARLLSGENRQGVLVGWEQGQLLFRAGDSLWKCPIEELVYWGELSDVQGPSCLFLQDGSALAGRLTAVTTDELGWVHPELGELRLPRVVCAGVVLKNPRDPTLKDRLMGTLLEEGEGVLFLNGDQLAGELRNWAGGETLTVSSVLGEQSFPLVNLRALRFRKSGTTAVIPAAQSETRVWIGLEDGSRILIRIDSRGDEKQHDAEAGGSRPSPYGDQVLRASLAGKIVTIPLKAVCFVQVLNKNIVYLSDLEPDRYLFVPFLEYVRPYYRDRNNRGGLLRVNRRVYIKGLGVYSASRLTYSLKKQFERFESELALDDLSQGAGSVVFRVLVDGQSRSVVGPVRGNENPRPIQVDVRGAERIDLVVEFSERADELDYADWLNARLIRSVSSQP